MDAHITEAVSRMQFEENHVSELPPQGSWSKASHCWSVDERDALILALACGRPLLVRGEPGTGKSQLARAAAKELGRRFLYEVIHPSIEAQDLLWRYDAVERLADAQRPDTPVKPARGYYRSGVLWKALHPDSAIAQDSGNPLQVGGAVGTVGAVVLIDEIDKADADLPHALLEVLGNQQFTTPWGDVVGRAGGPAPLIIVTTNEERELPLAFIRRCLVLEIQPPKQRHEFVDWLMKRGEARFPGMDAKVLDMAADQVARDRSRCPQEGARPGLAEYIDLLQAVSELTDDTETQRSWLTRLSRFALRKQPDRTQSAVDWVDEEDEQVKPAGVR